MAIAILGLGSLIWNPGELKLASGWFPGGPVLPVEFSCISADKRLTLVIDPVNGTEIATCFALSKLDTLPHAASDLAAREGCPVKNIATLAAGVDMNDKEWEERTIGEWLERTGLKGVVWASLDSNFVEKCGTAFSIEIALAYIRSLAEPERTNALDCFRKAPAQVRTRLRGVVEARYPA